MSRPSLLPPSHKPRIAMLAAGDVFGGAERQMLTLCRAGARLFEGIIFQSSAGPLAEEAARSGVEVRTELIGKGILSGGVALARSLQAERFDIIHAHGYRGSTLAAIARLVGNRLPLVRTMHGAPEAGVSRKMALYQLIGNISAHACLAHSTYVSHDLRRELTGDQEHPCAVIYNGVELPSSRPARPKEYEGSNINLVVAGRLEPVKGVTHAIRALHSKQLSSATHLHIVGDGPQREALERQVAREGLTSRAHFHGFREDVLAFIAHADVLLLPSLHEGIPYVLLEALAFGTPVVASNVGGIPEVVYNQHEAYLVPPHAPLAMAGAVSEILRDPILRERLATNGLQQVTANFSADVMAKEYNELYRRITSG